MSTTGIVLTACFITLGIYDFIVVCRRGVCCSISRCMQKAGFKSPIISLVIGALIGHFFLYMPPEVTERDVFEYLKLSAVSSAENTQDLPATIAYEDFSIFIVPHGKSVRFVEEE